MVACCSFLDGPKEFAKERWRRIKAEFIVELPLLKARWKQVLFGAMFQYVHGIFTQLAHRMHRPQVEPLHDIGFEYMPELGLRNAWVSESIFWCLFIPFILWSFSPFVTMRKRFYTAVIYARLLMVLTTCQILRIISFTVTQLPAPNYHCRLGKDTAVREMPEHWWGHIVVDVGRQSTHGCGDLIFSSHTTFVLTGILTFTEYGQTLLIKIIGWIGVAFMSLCIIASRKHYSVDVVVAWYTVPLVFYTMHRRWTTVRPAADYWPHRPLLGEEGLELAGGGGSGEQNGYLDDKGLEGKPLLPIHSRSASLAGGPSHSRSGSHVTAPAVPAHSRSSSRSAAELKSATANGKPLMGPGGGADYSFAVAVDVPPPEISEGSALGVPRAPSSHNIQQRGRGSTTAIPVLQAGSAPDGFEAYSDSPLAARSGSASAGGGSSSSGGCCVM